jgi:cell division septation protein DedD
VAQQIQDDGFHEIQLNGKQLVFLFMAATVVSVVIFLCGVLVGRGVRAQVAGAGENAALNSVAETTPTQPVVPAPTPTAGSDPTKAAPPPASDELSYFNRLEKQNPPAEHLKLASEPAPAKETPAPAKEPPAKEPPKTPAIAAAPAPPPPAPAPAPSSSTSEPSGPGFAVQIAALNVRSEADAIAKRLSSKGYAAYVMTPASGTPSVFRVRVGKFNTRREAETVAAKLQKEEQFKPWVTR